MREGWTRVPFGEMAEIVNDRVDNPAEAGVDRYVGLEHLDSNSLTIRRWGSPSDVEATKLRFRAGDIIFGRRRAYQRKLGVASFDGICSAHAMVLRAKPKLVVPAFLPFFMQSDMFMDRAVSISVGSLSPTINWTSLASQEFLLPPSSEQERIAVALDACTVADERLRDVADLAGQAEEAFMVRLFAYQGDGASVCGNLRTPSDWTPMTLPEMVVDEPNALTAGPFGTIFKAKDFRATGIPIIQLRHVTAGGLSFGNLTYMDPAVYRKFHTPFAVRHGDLLLTKMGDPPGVACLYSERDIAMVTPDVIKATLDVQKVNPEFAVALFNNARSRVNIRQLCKGGTRTRVSLRELYALEWPIPPLAEQARIVGTLRSLRRGLDAAAEARQGIAQVHDRISQAFTRSEPR